MENDKKIDNIEENNELDLNQDESAIESMQTLDIENKKNDLETKDENNDVKKKRFKLFERLTNRKINNTTPTLTKGKKNEYIHSNFKRKKEEEPDPETFPKKKKILSWQEEELLLVDGAEYDQELADEIAEIAERKD